MRGSLFSLTGQNTFFEIYWESMPRGVREEMRLNWCAEPLRKVGLGGIGRLFLETQMLEGAFPRRPYMLLNSFIDFKLFVLSLVLYRFE